METAPPELTKHSLWVQLRSLSGIYWIANWMELVERFAYYGVRVVLPVFMVAALERGGPELTHVQKGNIYGVWALIQSFVPILTGGFADRYGFKLNIAISTALKIAGYLLMGYCIVLAQYFAGVPIREARAQGNDATYELFFAGAMLLALGTAIFKPGLQGLLAHQIPRKASALGWGLFYQMVNIGGFAGPFLAGYLRVLDWTYVFWTCALGIALNFVPLFFFKEPEHHGAENRAKPLDLLRAGIDGLLEPRLFFFTVSFAGFWLMFYQLYDILPNFIDDWIDSRPTASALIGVFGEAAVPTVNGGNLTQEWIINFSSLLISCFVGLMGYVTGKLRSLTAIVLGISIAAVAIYGLGLSMSGSWTLLMVALFAVGEMTACPTQYRYMAAIAPKGKEGLYMGYVNMTVGIGWSIGSVVAGEMYQQGGDKITLARRYMADRAAAGQHLVQGAGSEQIAALSRNDVLPQFEKMFGVDAAQTRTLLWDVYQPYRMWLTFTAIGLISMLMVAAYAYVTRRADKDPQHSFNTHGKRWVQLALLPICSALIWASVYRFSAAVLIQAILFTLVLLASFFMRSQSADPDTAELPAAPADSLS